MRILRTDVAKIDQCCYGNMHCSAVWATVAIEKTIACYSDSDMQEIVFMCKLKMFLAPLRL